MSDLILQLKCCTGTFPVTVSSTCAISDLRDQVSVLCNKPATSIKLFLGFPPKLLQKLEGSVETVGIKSGDTIIAEVDSSSSSIQHEQVKTENNILKHVTKQEVRDGVPLMLRKVVPADNSSLFTSMAFVLGGKINLDSGEFMRKIIANEIMVNQEEFSETILGKPNGDYHDWILNPNSCGGAIEVSILSNFYGIEIVVIDAQSGSISKFGEDNGYDHKVFFIYDGVHYDPLYSESPLTPGKIQTLFSKHDDQMLKAAQMLANEEKSS